MFLEALYLEFFAAVRAWNLSCQRLFRIIVLSSSKDELEPFETQSTNTYTLIYTVDEACQQLAGKLMEKDGTRWTMRR